MEHLNTYTNTHDTGMNGRNFEVDLRAYLKSVIISAPRLATMLSLFLGSLNGLSNEADVRPYTELIAIFRA